MAETFALYGVISTFSIGIKATHLGRPKRIVAADSLIGDMCSGDGAQHRSCTTSRSALPVSSALTVHR
jgi:hypothetical protein